MQHNVLFVSTDGWLEKNKIELVRMGGASRNQIRHVIELLKFNIALGTAPFATPSDLEKLTLDIQAIFRVGRWKHHQTECFLRLPPGPQPSLQSTPSLFVRVRLAAGIQQSDFVVRIYKEKVRS